MVPLPVVPPDPIGPPVSATASIVVEPATAAAGVTASQDPGRQVPAPHVSARVAAPDWLEADIGAYVQALVADRFLSNSGSAAPSAAAPISPGQATPPLPGVPVPPGSAPQSLQATAPHRIGLNHAQILLNARPSQLTGLTLRFEAAGSAPYLVEGYGTLGGGWFSLDLGTIRAPLGAEFLADDWSLPTVTRAGYIDSPIDGTFGPTFGAFTEPAVQVSVAGAQTALKLFLGAPDAAARLESSPFPQVRLGAYYLAPNPFFPNATLGRVTSETRSSQFRDRWGGDARWRIGDFLLAAEFLRGFETRTADGGYRTFSFGMQQYVLWDVGPDDQLLGRYESFSPSFANHPGDTRQTLVVGWNRALPAPGARLQLQYARDFIPGGGSAGRILAAVGLKL